VVRWVLRILVLLLLVSMLKNVWAPQPQVFITWPEGMNWTQKLAWEVRKWQSLLQDLPASIEAEIRQIWDEFQPDGNGESV